MQAAQARLQELENRLERLQMLDDQIKKLKASEARDRLRWVGPLWAASCVRVARVRRLTAEIYTVCVKLCVREARDSMCVCERERDGDGVGDWQS